MSDAIRWTRWAIIPNAKVRSMKSDIWKKRPCWVKYCAFKDQVQRLGITFESGDHVIFHIPMPASWPAKKKALMVGSKHETKPDIDNVFGGLLDAVYASAERGGKGDQHIHSVGSLKKVWAYEGAIEIGRAT